MNRKNQHGFAHILAVFLVIIVLGAIGGTGYYVYHKNHGPKKDVSSSSQKPDNKTTAKVTNYEECTKTAGSKILTTFPSQCLTKSGQTFTQPNSQEYLTIKEWGVRAKYSGPLTLQYVIDGNTATFTSAQLVASDSRCEGFGGKIVRKLPADDDYPVVQGSTAADVAAKNSDVGRAGGHYFFFIHDQSGCAGDIDQPISDKTLMLLSQTENAVKDIAASLESVPTD